MRVETVKIVAPISDDNPLGFVVINEEDFDEKTMRRWNKDSASAASAPVGADHPRPKSRLKKAAPAA